MSNPLDQTLVRDLAGLFEARDDGGSLRRPSDRDLAAVRKALKRPHLEYFKDFYADTASFGSRKAIEHAIEFFGEDRVLFASDAPFDPEKGPMYIRETIRILEELDVSEATRAKLFHGNTERLLGLKG